MRWWKWAAGWWVVWGAATAVAPGTSSGALRLIGKWAGRLGRAEGGGACSEDGSWEWRLAWRGAGAENETSGRGCRSAWVTGQGGLDGPLAFCARQAACTTEPRCVRLRSPQLELEAELCCWSVGGAACSQDGYFFPHRRLWQLAPAAGLSLLYCLVAAVFSLLFTCFLRILAKDVLRTIKSCDQELQCLEKAKALRWLEKWAGKVGGEVDQEMQRACEDAEEALAMHPHNWPREDMEELNVTGWRSGLYVLEAPLHRLPDLRLWLSWDELENMGLEQLFAVARTDPNYATLAGISTLRSHYTSEKQCGDSPIDRPQSIASFASYLFRSGKDRRSTDRDIPGHSTSLVTHSPPPSSQSHFNTTVMTNTKTYFV